LRKVGIFPSRFEQGNAPAEFPSSPKDVYRQIYSESIDLAIVSINNRFDQPGLRIYSNIEQLLFKASSGNDYTEELKAVCDFYEGDLSRCDLEAELKILGTLFTEKAENDRPTISLLKTVLQSLTSTQRELISAVNMAFQLLLLMPATNCISER